jgi:hypothetical protein
VLDREATNTNFIVFDFGFTRSGLKPMIYRTQGEHPKPKLSTGPEYRNGGNKIC